MDVRPSMTGSLNLATESFDAWNPLPLVIAGGVVLTIGIVLHVVDLVQKSSQSGTIATGITCTLAGVTVLGFGIASAMNDQEAPTAIPGLVKDDPAYRVAEEQVPAALEDHYGIVVLDGPYEKSDEVEGFFLIQTSGGASVECNLQLYGQPTGDGQAGALLCDGSEPQHVTAQ